MSVYSYAKALLADIEDAKSRKDSDRQSELQTEFDKVKDDAVKDAHARLADGDQMTATVLSNGQAVPSTVRGEVEDFLRGAGADVPSDSDKDFGTDPIAPSLVDPPLAANPANLVDGDGTDPVKTPPVVTQIQANGVATVVAPSAPEGDTSGPAPTVTLDTSSISGVGSDTKPLEDTAAVPARPAAPAAAAAPVAK